MSRARVVLCRVGEKPCVTWLDSDRNGDYATAMAFLVGVLVRGWATIGTWYVAVLAIFPGSR